MKVKNLKILPLITANWLDFELLFGKEGAHGGCWCMWWRIPEKEFKKQSGETNKKAIHNYVESGKIPGIIGYINNMPISWCSFGPREEFPSLKNYIRFGESEKNVWSIVCFFIDKNYRLKGITKEMVQYAMIYAKNHGAESIEAYPTTSINKLEAYSGCTGIVSVFEKLGFSEIYKTKGNFAVMKYKIDTN